MLTLKRKILAATERAFARKVKEIYLSVKRDVDKLWFKKLKASLSVKYGPGATRASFYGQTMPFYRSMELLKTLQMSFTPSNMNQLKIARIGDGYRTRFTIKSKLGPAKNKGFDYSRALDKSDRYITKGYRTYAFEKLGEVIQRTVGAR